MGDHRTSVTLIMHCHGRAYRTDLDINYGAYGECEGVDDRIIEFFRNSWEDSLSFYHDRVAEYDRKEVEKVERAELTRLCLKYPDGV